MNLVLLRAALGAALLFLSTSAYAKSTGIETYKDIIEKAHNLSLQNDRPQALRILSVAVKKETRPQAIAELKKVSRELSQIFLSDKSQQLYESGLSLKKNDPGEALDKIQEALKLEPENSLIVIEQARLQMMRGDCRQALSSLQKQIQLVPADEDLRLTQAQAAVCLQDWDEYEKAKAAGLDKKATPSEFWLILEVERLLSRKNEQKAQEILSQVRKTAEKYPEVHYWQQFLEQKTKKPFQVSAQKYVMSCKNISVTLYRQYMIDPMLCRRISEVEADLKGLHATTD